MKKRIYMITILLTAGLFAGCGKEGTKQNDLSIESTASQVKEQSGLVDRENNDMTWNDKLEIDFTCDYSEDIKADVDNLVSGSPSCRKNWRILRSLYKSILRWQRQLRPREK